MVWEACAGPQLISVGFMHEDLWREPGLRNTACLASCGKEHELTNIFIPDNYFKVVPPWLSTELSKTQYLICVLADILWSVFSPLPVLIDFAFLELHHEQTGSRRSLLSHGRDGKLCRLKPSSPPAGKPSWFPFHGVLTMWQWAPADARCWGSSIHLVWFVSSNRSKG